MVSCRGPSLSKASAARSELRVLMRAERLEPRHERAESGRVMSVHVYTARRLRMSYEERSVSLSHEVVWAGSKYCAQQQVLIVPRMPLALSARVLNAAAKRSHR